jgi:hypothetical protein
MPQNSAVHARPLAVSKLVHFVTQAQSNPDVSAVESHARRAAVSIEVADYLAITGAQFLQPRPVR